MEFNVKLVQKMPYSTRKPQFQVINRFYSTKCIDLCFGMARKYAFHNEKTIFDGDTRKTNKNTAHPFFTDRDRSIDLSMKRSPSTISNRTFQQSSHSTVSLLVCSHKNMHMDLRSNSHKMPLIFFSQFLLFRVPSLFSSFFIGLICVLQSIVHRTRIFSPCEEIFQNKQR